jgi:hypothetical protein
MRPSKNFAAIEAREIRIQSRIVALKQLAAHTARVIERVARNHNVPLRVCASRLLDLPGRPEASKRTR